MLRSKSRSGYLEFGEKKHSSVLIRSISRSKICRGDAHGSQIDKEALVSVDRNSRNSVSLSENRIVKAAMMQKQMSNLEEDLRNTKEKLDAAKVFEKTLAEREASLDEMKQELLESKHSEARAMDLLSETKKRVQELEAQLEKSKQSESNMLESLILQTRQMEQTKMDLEESKLEIANLQEKVEKLHNSRGMVDCSQDGEKIASLKGEIAKLKNELQMAMEAEEKSKGAMDGLASALKEVAMEASMANEKLKSTENELTHLREEAEQLKEMLRTAEEKYKNEIEDQKTEINRLRVEAEESLLAWTGKEMGFVSCIRRADEENALTKHENNRLKEALVAAENTTRIAREESYKLRDILKQALNESNVAKEAASIARAENSELKDLLAEKEESLHFLTKENERLRIDEVAACENVKEFKRLLAAKTEAKACEDKEQTDVFNSPLSSLYEEHLDGRMTPQKTFSFDFDELKLFNKEDEGATEGEGEAEGEGEREAEGAGAEEADDDGPTNIVVHEDPEKAEALKGSIFDTVASPRSEPHTPEPKLHNRRDSSVYSDTGGTGQAEEGENVHTDDGEEKGYYLYSRKRLFRKIGELIIGKSYSKKEGTTEHGKEQAKEETKEQAN